MKSVLLQQNFLFTRIALLMATIITTETYPVVCTRRYSQWRESTGDFIMENEIVQTHFDRDFDAVFISRNSIVCAPLTDVLSNSFYRRFLLICSTNFFPNFLAFSENSDFALSEKLFFLMGSKNEKYRHVELFLNYFFIKFHLSELA